MTTSIPYRTTTKQEGQHEIVLHSITATPEYESRSFEELRLDDYYLAEGKGEKFKLLRTAPRTAAAINGGRDDDQYTLIQALPDP